MHSELAYLVAKAREADALRAAERPRVAADVVTPAPRKLRRVAVLLSLSERKQERAVRRAARPTKPQADIRGWAD
jgi:hypothetical protein